MNTETLLNNVATINQDNAIIVDAKEFLKELRQVAVSVAKPTDHRPNLTFVHVRINQDSLTLEATDSHTMQQVTIPANIPSELTDKEFLIDGKFAKNLSKSPTKLGKQLGIIPEIKNGKYTGITVFTANGEKYIDDSRGNVSVFGYPDLDCLRPYEDRAAVQFEVTKKEIYAGLQEMKKLIKKTAGHVVHQEFNDEEVIVGYEEILDHKFTKESVVNTWNVTNYKFNSEKWVSGNEGLYIDYNVDYLIKHLRHCGMNEKLIFRFYGMRRPFTVTRENGGLSIICPVRSY